MNESHTNTQPRRLGDFEIVCELGRGGMGIVYEARQVSLNRKVALKVLSHSLGLTTRAILRFQREAEAAAKLHHTNIVPIYATGEQDGAHYYAMELIEGPGLDQVIAQIREMQKPAWQEDMPMAASPNAATASSTPFPADWVCRTMNFPSPGDTTIGKSQIHSSTSGSLASGSGYFDTVARMMAEVADALDYAHAQGVIHRDIKPSNLLLSLVGRLSMNDFGLARMLEQPGMTVSGEFVGSPMYMSPEQIAVGRAPLDHRTDIYSLGATLYELLTLQPPFPGVRRDQIIAQIIGKEPKPPRSLNRRVPADLETICLKMMEKDPDKRYQTAGDVAEDLRRYVNRFAISARRVGVAGRVVRWTKRNKAIAASLCFVVLLGLLASVFAYRSHRSEQRAMEEKRDHAVELAMLIAMGGDLNGAEKAIAEAEKVDASHGSIHMIRGLLALYRGDARPAINELKKAVDLLPQSVAAYALLAYAYAVDGQLDLCQAVFIDHIEKLPAVTPEDYLFKGRIEVGWDARGLKDLDEAIRRRDSTIARVLRADGRSYVALNTSDVSMAQSALEDASAAKSMMPGNPVVIASDLGAHLAAMVVFRDAGDKDQADQSSDEAKKDVRELQRFAAFPFGYVMRVVYLNLTGQEGAAHEVARQGYEQAKSPINCYNYVYSLYLQGDFHRALEVIEQATGGTEASNNNAKLDSSVSLLRAAIRAELNDYSRAVQDYNDSRGSWTEGYSALVNQATGFLLGKKDLAIRDCNELRSHPERRSLNSEHVQRILDYWLGDLPEQDFLKAEGGSRVNRCEAHFYMAVDLLAQGRRTAAREHFQKAVDTGVFGFFEYDWSRLFLKRMEQDPNWPPWIPLQQPTTQPTTNVRQ
jgi:serine/threonine protein kinase/lipoprotein NlpI